MEILEPLIYIIVILAVGVWIYAKTTAFDPGKLGAGQKKIFDDKLREMMKDDKDWKKHWRDK